ncbi:putative copper resistance protein D [Tistlia consotensis]|uniref:Putative copper resistance protein D n=1 Tax=Tistlia consotensis USBA 355 TaxID=560819 RepID=A0A1Y6B6J5_9PROT|nr:copper homeostasis membrane protein CopD [Tistlia consotensis]SME90745.1 putative copper resistance protein D [Tistlia consotensis USBA 355]SNR26921.1 putative copper resistance protein D [Tistlia consotensis]
MTGPIAALALCRLTFDAAGALLFGASLFLAVLAPATLRGALAPRLGPTLRAAVVLVPVATLLWLPLEAAQIGGAWHSALDLDLLSALLFDTSLGSVWLARAALCGLLAAGFLTTRRPVLAVGRPWAIVATCSGLLLASLALSGHAAADEGARGTVQAGNEALHVLSGGAWLGALAVLPPCLAALREPSLRRQAELALRRFSTAGHGAVALVIATGLANTALVLGRWPTDWSSPYQVLLVAKVALVAVMVGLALSNRYLLMPRLAGGHEAALGSIGRRALAELALGAAALALVAVFGLLDPTG